MFHTRPDLITGGASDTMDEEQIAIFEEFSPEDPDGTRPYRVELAQAFFAGNQGWESIDDIHTRLRANTPRLGYARVYRVMRALHQAGFVERQGQQGTSAVFRSAL